MSSTRRTNPGSKETERPNPSRTIRRAVPVRANRIRRIGYWLVGFLLVGVVGAVLYVATTQAPPPVEEKPPVEVVQNPNKSEVPVVEPVTIPTPKTEPKKTTPIIVKKEPPKARPLILNPGLTGYGGIEIGGSGVKAVVISVDRNGKVPVVQRVYGKTSEVSLALIKNGKLQKELIEAAADDAALFYRILREEGPLPPEKIHIIVGSAFSDLDADEKEKLVSALKRKLLPAPKNILMIDPFVETSLLIRGLRSIDGQETSVVDIGSGSTKCGYFIDDSPTALAQDVTMKASIPGTKKYFQFVKEARDQMKNPLSFLQVAQNLAKERIRDPLQNTHDRHPGFGNRRKVVLMGGVIWAIFTLSYPEQIASDGNELAAISYRDIDRFSKALFANPDRLPTADLLRVRAEDMARVKKEISRVEGNFTPDQMVCGCTILMNLSDVFRLNNSSKSLYFARNSQFTWLTAYLEQLAGSE